MGQEFPGVFAAQKKDGTVYYRASLTHQKKHISLGSYPTAFIAHGAYLEGSALLADTSLTISAYSSRQVLPFGKWVCLINFRDNNIYFSTPIYVRKKYFEYYLTPKDILKFDIDDLFYYSSHKIMCRGRHFFVADYGMQINIMSRYGIKNYAVEGRDYRFINGNSQDLRYENIEIINRYNGVYAVNTNGTIHYQVKIHVKGNINVGTYTSETEAAIAYNKAVDMLKKAGVNKDYSPNYMEGMSPAAYADLYASVKISSGVRNYRCE